MTIAKDWVEIISSSLTAMALIIGAAIAWWRWGRERPQDIRANLSHQIFIAPFDKENYILHVTLEIQNKGNVHIDLYSGTTAVLKISPVDEEIKAVLDKGVMAGNGTEIDWPFLAKREYNNEKPGLSIDSNETDYIYCDFIIPKYHEVIGIWSLVYFVEGKYSWICSTLVNIDDQLKIQAA